MNDLRSFFVAGFEASTMRRADGRRNDLVSATRHDQLADRDYERVADVGIAVVREGAAWHLLQPRPGAFDPTSVLRRIRSARARDIQVIWDLCHFGWPEYLDPFDPAFVDRFRAFAHAFATLLRDETDQVPWYVPVNEPSFVAWAGGDVAYLNPFQRGRGDALKRQLVRAALAASAAVRDVDPRARICHVDPVIHIEPGRDADEDGRRRVARHVAAQYDAWDMLGGRKDDDLGGSDAELDVIGINYYDRNQWIDGGPILAPGDPGHRPLRELLADVYARYRRPILIAETGTEGDARVPWLRSVADEVVAARHGGIPILGICLYPVLDHPGWDDDRHLPVGLWGYPDAAGARPAYQPLIDEVQRQAARMDTAPSPLHAAGLAVATDSRSGAGVVFAEGRVDRQAVRRLPPLRICLATDSRDPSGVGGVMLTLGRGLVRLGHEVTISAPDALDARWLIDGAASAGMGARALPDASPWAQAAALGDRLRADPPDIVNVHAGIGWEGQPLAAAAARSGAVVIRTEHLPYLLTKPAEESAYFAALADVDGVIAVSDGVAASLIAAGVPNGLVNVVRNGIDAVPPVTEASVTRARLGVTADAPLIVAVGRLTAQKGYDVLLEAVRGLNDAVEGLRVVIVGTGRLEDDLAERRRDLNLDAVVDILPRWHDIRSLLAAADVVAFASRFEGLPLVALEAMSVGTAVVATQVCGLEEAVVDGETGRLVPPDDAAALASAIRDVLEHRSTTAGYAQAARRRLGALFTADRMARETEAVYLVQHAIRAAPSPAHHAAARAELPAPVLTR